MKILFLTNNEITVPLHDWLRDFRGEETVLTGERLSREFIESTRPDFSVSYNYRFILPPDQIALLHDKIINIHISLLPWNRGVAPNLWSFLKDTPKGVTIHKIDAGLDTGQILAQEEVVFDEQSETLESSYQKLHEHAQRLFRKNWSKIRQRLIPGKIQSGSGSSQSKADFDAIKHITEPEGWRIPIPELKRRYTASMFADPS